MNSKDDFGLMGMLDDLSMSGMNWLLLREECHAFISFWLLNLHPDFTQKSRRSCLAFFLLLPRPLLNVDHFTG